MGNQLPLLVGGNASVYVSDMERAILFYTKSLGLHLITRIGDEWAEIDAGNGLVIGLHPARPLATPVPGTIGAINIELRVSDALTLEAVVAELQGRGVAFQGPIASYEHVKLASLIDPDGNVILLAQQITS